MYNNSIVLGTCWYNESVDTLINFCKNSKQSLEQIGFKVTIIVFDARYVHNENEIALIKKEVANVKIILNRLNVFPNKNYGVALITNLAHKLKINHIVIVDPDWDIKENYSFTKNVISQLIDNDYDIVIPNINKASGRSNILIGKTAVCLFYPEYSDVLQSVFPGAIASKTDKLYMIVSDKDYHFDWGGEWDIISLAIRNKMKISSVNVDVKNVRHRSNISKMQDSFQIWKAILGNKDILNRYENIKKYNIENKENRFYNLISNTAGVMEIIKIIDSNNPSKTERQILYMILYPLALLMGEIDRIPEVETKYKMPYNKKELNDISNFAIYCMKIALINSNIKKINQKAKNINGEYFSKWNNYIYEGILEEMDVI